MLNKQPCNSKMLSKINKLFTSKTLFFGIYVFTIAACSTNNVIPSNSQSILEKEKIAKPTITRSGNDVTINFDKNKIDSGTSITFEVNFKPKGFNVKATPNDVTHLRVWLIDLPTLTEGDVVNGPSVLAEHDFIITSTNPTTKPATITFSNVPPNSTATSSYRIAGAPFDGPPATGNNLSRIATPSNNTITVNGVLAYFSNSGGDGTGAVKVDAFNKISPSTATNALRIPMKVSP